MSDAPLLVSRMSLDESVRVPDEGSWRETLAEIPSLASYEGLTDAQAAAQYERHGPNSLPEVNNPMWRRLLLHLVGPMSLLMFAVVVISGVVGDFATMGVVLFLLTVNSLIGTMEEAQAEKALKALRDSLSLNAFVQRSGSWTEIPAADLVPKDLIKIRIGDIVPADCVLQKGRRLEIDQSVVTGESLPVIKDAEDFVFSGTTVKSGEMTAVVVGTGVNSSSGRTASLMKDPRVRTHLQQFMLRVTLVLIIVAVILTTILMIVQLRDPAIPALHTIELALSIIVASIPIALPAVTTGTLALGSRALSKKGVITARLNSIEQLAGMDVAVVDKTGTLTQNKLTLYDPWLAEGITRQKLLSWASLASSQEAPDAIDAVIVRGAPSIAREQYVVRSYTPYDPVRKRASATLLDTTNNAEVHVMKGATHVILEEGRFSAELKERVNAVVADFGARGLRSLAVAVQETKGAPWRMAGVIAILDALRPDAKATVALLAGEGVEVKIATGDHGAIARETCRQLGMGDQVRDRRFFEAVPTERRTWVTNALETTNAFAQIFPEDKYDLVSLMQQRGHIVGMTGDGVNDCPALTKANVGIAVDSASNAARSAADIILTRDNFSVIHDAILESRCIYERLRNYIIYRINSTTEVLLWTFISAVALDFRFPALVLVGIALLNDGTILSLAYDHVLPARRPVRWQLKEVVPVSLVIGVISMLEVLATYQTARAGALLFGPTPLANGVVRSAVFLNLCVSDQLTAFICRTRYFIFSKRSARPGYLLIAAVTVSCTVASLLAAFWPFTFVTSAQLLPLPGAGVAMCWIIMIVFFWLKEVAKLATYYVIDKISPPTPLMIPLSGSGNEFDLV